MKKESTFKRLLSVLLVCAMLVGLLPQIVVAETTGSGSGTAVNSITLDKAGMAIIKGDTKKLTATVDPEGAAVTWRSSDDQKVAVHNGVVTAKEAGTVTITAEAGDKSVSCVVTVTEADYNLIPNGGFEDFTTTEALFQPNGNSNIAITDWMQDTANVTTQVVEDGNDKAFAITGNGYLWYTIPAAQLVPGETYTMTCNLKMNAEGVTPSSSNALIQQVWRRGTSGSATTLTAGRIFHTTTAAKTQWQTSSNTITIPANNTSVVQVGVQTRNMKTGQFLVDDFSLVPVNKVAVTELTLDQTAITLGVGGEATLGATVAPENASNKNVRWMSSDPTVATVIGGKIVALKAGTATITATAGVAGDEKTATCTVTVGSQAIPVEGITLNKNAVELNVGGEETLTATVSPDNATDQTVTWESSDPTVAKVENGKITALKVGTATITATAGDNKTATCAVEVKPIAVAGITLDQDSVILNVGNEVTLTATVSPENATDKTVIWESSDPTVATVENGKITAVATGTATITAKAGDKTAECTVTVSNQDIPVEGIALDKAGLGLKVGGTKALIATVLPENATNSTVTWSSSNTAVATVAADGTVTAVAVGTATITATAGDKTATCLVTVSAADDNLLPNGGFDSYYTEDPVTQGGTSDSYANSNIAVSDWTQFNKGAVTQVVTGRDGTGHALQISGSEKSQFKYVIPADQLVAGEYTLTAWLKALPGTAQPAGWSGQARLQMYYSLGSKVDNTSWRILQGQTDSWKEITVNITVPAGKSLEVGFWTSNLGAGGFLIDDVSLVLVEANVPVTGVELNKTTLDMVAGTEETLTATISPANATNKEIIWKSNNESVATVDANGKITAVNAGTATITATVGDKSATCTVNITLPAGDVSVQKVELNKNGTLLPVGGTAELSANVLPVYAVDKTVTWSSSNPAVATVDANGKVTAIAEGTAVITAKAGEKTDTCTVLVSAEAGLNLIPNGGFEDFRNGVFTQGGDANDYANTNIAVSDWKQYYVGAVTEVVPGRNNVGHALKITSSKKTETTYYADAEFYYTVPAEKLTPGAKYVLTGWLKALDGTTSTTSSQALVRIRYKLGSGSTVDNTNWRVLQGGADWKKVTIEIEVPENHTGGLTIYIQSMRPKTGGFLVDDLYLVQIPQSITMPKEEVFVELGQTVTLPATVGPESVLDKRVIYLSSDETVVKVDANGKVTPVGVGTAIITAASVNGGPSAECVVYVVEDYVELESLSIKSATSLQTGGREKLTATLTPANPSDKELTWSSSDESVVKVSADGQLTALSAGTATITVTGMGGKSAQCVVTVTSSTTLTAQAVQLSIPFGKTYSGNFTGSVTNNTGAAVKYTVYQNPQMGTLKVNADGTYTYLPRPNFDTTKTDSFIVLVTAGDQSTLINGVISVSPLAEIIQQQLVPGTTLMISKEELAAIRAEIAKEGTLHNQIWTKYEKYVKSLLSWEAPDYEDMTVDDREREYAEWQRTVGNNIETLLFGYLLTGDEAYKTKAIEAAVTSANYYAWGESTWYNQAGLCAGHQGFAISLVYNWLREDMTEQQRNDIVRRMYQTCERVRNRHNNTYIQNTYWVSNSALYAGSMAMYQYPQDVVAAMQGVEGYEGLTAEQVRANCESWITFGVGIIGNVLEMMPQDGTNYEGSTYHQYGMEYMLRNCIMFNKVLGVDMFTNAKWLENSSEFYSAIMVSENTINASNMHIPFGDSVRNNWYGPSHIYRTLAGIYKDGTAQWIAEVSEEKKVDTASASIWMSLLYMDPSVEAVSPLEAGRGTMFYGDDLDLVVSRTNWSGDEAMVMLRCGLPVGKTQSEKETLSNLLSSNNEDHVDADINALYLYYNGEFLLRPDLKYDKYTGNYSTLMVGGKGQFGDAKPEGSSFRDTDFYKYDAKPYIKKAESTATYDYFVGDGTEAYNPELGLTRFERNVILLKEDNVLLVLDDIATINPEIELELRWFPENKLVSENYGIYTVYGSKTNMKFFPFTTEGVTTSFEEVKVYTNLSKEGAFSQKYKGTSWQNAVAFSWSTVDAEQAIVRYLSGGTNLHKFEVNGKIYTVDIKKNTVTVETGSLGIVDPWADNSELSNILFNGQSLEGFDSKTLTYNVDKFWKVPDIQIVPVASAPSAQVEMDWDGKCPGKVTITVTSEDKSSVSTYVINLTDEKGLLDIAGATADAKDETVLYTYDSYFVPSVSGKTWAAKACLPTVIYDMGQLVDISKIDIAFNASSERASYYDLYTSVDGVNWTVFAKDQLAPKTPKADGYHIYQTIAENVGQVRYIKIYLRGFTEGDTYGDGLDDVASYKGFQEISFYGKVVEPDMIVEDTTVTVTDTGMSNAITAAGNKDQVVLDVESKEDSAVQVVLPVDGLKNIAEAEKELVIQLGQATATFDNAALAAITAAAGNKSTVEFTIVPVQMENLEDAQVEALEDYNVAMTFAVTLVCDGQEISTFGTGKVTVRVPFTPAEGTLASEYRIAYISDDGDVEILETVSGDGYLEVTLEHFSEYAVVRVQEKTPETGDNQMVLLLAAVSLACVAALAVLAMNRKRYF